MTTKALPFVPSMTGSDPLVLWNGYRAAKAAVDAAADALRLTRPNGRDYRSVDDLRVAILEHDEREAKLRLVSEDLETLVRIVACGQRAR